MGKARFQDCQGCGTKVQVPSGYQGYDWCDECVYEWVKGGSRQDVLSQDLDNLNEFAIRNTIETSDI